MASRECFVAWPSRLRKAPIRGPSTSVGAFHCARSQYLLPSRKTSASSGNSSIGCCRACGADGKPNTTIAITPKFHSAWTDFEQSAPANAAPRLRLRPRQKGHDTGRSRAGWGIGRLPAPPSIPRWRRTGSRTSGEIDRRQRLRRLPTPSRLSVPMTRLTRARINGPRRPLILWRSVEPTP